MRSQLCFTIAIAILGAVFVNKAHADTHVAQKLFQLPGPETRSRCIKELKTKGIPACTVHGFDLKCDDTWIVTCSEWATDFEQHEFFLVVTGPDAPTDALKPVLTHALTHALDAAAAAGLAAVGAGGVAAVPVATGAAIATFKTVFIADLAGEAALSGLFNKFGLKIERHDSW